MFYINGCWMFFVLVWMVGLVMVLWVMVVYLYEGLFFCMVGCFLVFVVVVWCYVLVDVCVEGGVKLLVLLLREVLKCGDVLVYFVGFVLLFVLGMIGMMNLLLFIFEELVGME